MNEDHKEKKELEEYGKVLDIEDARARMYFEYSELIPLLRYAPIALAKNYSRFENDLLKAQRLFTEKTEYDPSIFGIIKDRWAREITAAKRLSENGTIDPSIVANKYMKINNEITPNDFDYHVWDIFR